MAFFKRFFGCCGTGQKVDNHSFRLSTITGAANSTNSVVFAPAAPIVQPYNSTPKNCGVDSDDDTNEYCNIDETPMIVKITNYQPGVKSFPPHY